MVGSKLCLLCWKAVLIKSIFIWFQNYRIFSTFFSFYFLYLLCANVPTFAKRMFFIVIYFDEVIKVLDWKNNFKMTCIFLQVHFSTMDIGIARLYFSLTTELCRLANRGYLFLYDFFFGCLRNYSFFFKEIFFMGNLFDN